ncbi:Rap1a/Tai family immunity protein [Methylobacterium sp. WSM2598]|uniref:Rap1a/Tai family immunity protein n=1 Tax=Methylobacterium sp. WSM2598 TaxID=398261 RepID=UPI0003A564B9|nr:Rap1a/Tai family immunity protein [Methylobacterium sp. WSM2598]
MVRWMLVVATAACLAASDASAADGDQIVTQCKSLLRTAKQRGDTLDYRQDPDTVSCFAFMSAVQNLAVVAERADAPPLLGACLPPEGTLLQLIRAVVAYGKAHPPALRESAGVLALLALRDAYPCDKKG